MEDLVKHDDFGQDLDPNVTQVDGPFEEHPGLEPIRSWAHGLILIGTRRPPEPQASKDAERALSMGSTGASPASAVMAASRSAMSRSRSSAACW